MELKFRKKPTNKETKIIYFVYLLCLASLTPPPPPKKRIIHLRFEVKNTLLLLCTQHENPCYVSLLISPQLFQCTPSKMPHKSQSVLQIPGTIERLHLSLGLREVWCLVSEVWCLPCFSNTFPLKLTIRPRLQVRFDEYP